MPAAEPTLPIAETLAPSFVIATAGHIDHGKSSLVQALTGIDPDRLEEEKRRGMTIDLGFAYLDLPGRVRVGIVDVPGHRRFLKNMLAGVHAIDAVLFVIAADEGPMPQTLEHLAIVDLLRIEHGVVALTKADLVAEDWLGLVTEEVRRVIGSSGLKSAPVIPVSSVTGAGLPALREALAQALHDVQPRPDTGRPRLAVDRSFAMAGFGTVVTGTLIGGTLVVGDELAILPAGRRVRVRGLQQHNRAVVKAQPGSRTAVNLAGVERSEVSRGDVLARPGLATPSRRIDVQLQVLPGAPHPLRHRARLLLYQGTAEVPVEVLLLDGDELSPGQQGWAQLFAEAPITALPGDRFVLRRPAPAATIAGGAIVDVRARRHRRRDPQVLSGLEARGRNDLKTTCAAELARWPQGITLADLALRLNLPVADVGQAVEALIAQGAAHRMGSVLVATVIVDVLRERMGSQLAAYHRAHPLRAGMPKEELRSRTGTPAMFPAMLNLLMQDGTLKDVGSEIALSGHTAALGPEQEASVAAVLADLEQTPLSPPPLSALVERHHLTPALIQYLVASGRIVRVNDDTIFSRRAYDEAVARLTEHLRREQKVSVAQARDVLRSSRRYVLPLLEWLDTQKVTRRVGDDRILRA